MKLDIRDIVQTVLYGPSILFKVVCFFDRPDRMPCNNHLWVPAKEGVDDVHLEVIWKKHVAIAPSWPIGASVVTGYSELQEPEGNEMLILGLAAA